VGRRIIQAPKGVVRNGANQGQLGLIRSRREGPQQRLDGLCLPIEHHAEGVVGEQPGRVGPVAGRLGMPDGVGHLALPEEPSGGLPVQGRHLFGQRPAQFQPEEVREQVVVAEPGPPGVQRDHERVRVLQVQQDPLRAGAASQQIGQLAVDPVHQAGAQQQVLSGGRLAVQQLGEQIRRDRTVAAGELRHEPLRIGVTGQRQHGQPQPRRPSLGPLMQ
jgi:hypothetical protein